MLETISGKAWLIDSTGDQRIAVTESPFVNNDFPLFRIYTNNFMPSNETKYKILEIFHNDSGLIQRDSKNVAKR